MMAFPTILNYMQSSLGMHVVEVNFCTYLKQAIWSLRTDPSPSDPRVVLQVLICSPDLKDNSVSLAPGVFPRTNLRRESKYMVLER